MTDKVSRRVFLRQIGIYSISLAVIGERAVDMHDRKRSFVGLTRVVYESLAGVLQLRRIFEGGKESLSIKPRADTSVSGSADTIAV